MARIIVPGKSAHPDFALPGRKPVGPVEIDRATALGAACDFVFLSPKYFRGRSLIATQGTGAYPNATRRGLGTYFDGTTNAYVDIGDYDAINGSQPFFIWALVEPGGVSGANREMIFGKDSSDANGRAFTFEINPRGESGTGDGQTGAIGMTLFQSNSLLKQYYTAANVLGNGSIYSIVAGPDSSRAALIYVNGLAVSAPVRGESLGDGTIQASATSTRIGSRVYSGYEDNFAGNIIALAVFKALPTQHFALQLATDPFGAFLRPANDPTFFLGTAVVAHGEIYVRSTDGNDPDSGFDWASAKATLAGAAAIDSAGDKIYVSDNHSETGSGDIALDGTVASPVWVISVDDVYDSDPPIDVSAGATVSTASTPAISGYAYFSGITFKTATAASNHQWILNPYSVTAGCLQVYEDCSFEFPATGSTARAYVNGATASNANDNHTIWTNCDYYTSNSSGGGISVVGRFEWNGGSILASHVATSAGLFVGLAAGRPAQIEVSGVDLSNMGETAPIFGYSAALTKGVVRNCKLPASWSGSLVTGTAKLGDRYELYNCDSADTNYRLWIEDYAGTIKHSATVYNDGGASDGTTRISWVMTSAANVKYPTILLRSPEIVRWNETVGSALTVTVEIVHNSQGSGSPTGLLYDDEIWLEVMYLGTSGYPLGSWITDCKSSVLARAAAQATSTASWTGDAGGWDTQKLSVTITPREKGFIHARIVVGKPSITVYVDPLLTVA